MRCDFIFNGSEQLVSIIWLSLCTRQISLRGSYAVIASVARSEVEHCIRLTSGLAWTVICFDAVSVWIDDEGSVVVGAVNRAQTGRTVVLPT
jgi:hypothetical protein